MIETNPTTESNPQIVVPLVWESEVFVVHGADRKELIERIELLVHFLEGHPQTNLKDLASTLACELQPTHPRLAVIAGSVEELKTRLIRGRDRLADGRTHMIRDSMGIYYFSEPLYRQGGVGLLFPGEGAQYLNMLRDLLPLFPEVQETFAEADQNQFPISPSFLIAADASEEEKIEAEKKLRTLAYSISSVSLADLALYRILEGLQIPVAAVAGHSAGELTALYVAGSLVSDQVLNIDQVISTMSNVEEGDTSVTDSRGTILLAVGAGASTVAGVVDKLGLGSGTYVAMDNCPHQCVVVGHREPMLKVEESLQNQGVICERLPFQRPYHTPLFEPYMEPLCSMFANSRFESPRIPIYCCTTGELFPDSEEEMRSLTLRHWTSPVEFTRLVNTMYEDGIRIFVETGPRGNLTAFTEDILRGKPVAALAANVVRRSGIQQLHHLVAQLVAHQVPLRLRFLHDRRQPETINWLTPTDNAQANPVPESTKENVMFNYFGVMESFLDVQHQVLQQYLSRPRQNSGGRLIHPLYLPAAEILPVVPVVDLPVELDAIEDANPLAPLEPGMQAPFIMLGTILQYLPGQELVSRRFLTLEEDLHLHDHALGGTAVSRVDPEQNGSPILPMTFSLETMAEAAATLFPGYKVLGLEGVKLNRWIAMMEGHPTILEIRANAIPATETDPLQRVSVTIADCGHDPENADSLRVTVEAQVIVGLDYPAQEPSQIEFTNERPSVISRERLYHSLFHGEMFRGIVENTRVGDLAIEGIGRVPQRHQWFASTTNPALLLDPVFLDISMHILCGWHLEQLDQSGRILLPFKLDRIEFFAPIPGPGTELIVRGGTDQETPRYMKHRIEVFDQEGQLIYRMSGAWYWRFYLPFQGKINFNSPKDEYFLSSNFNEALPVDAKACCMMLEPPVDLQQNLLQASTARVTSAPEELGQYFECEGNPVRRFEWLFVRLAGKDTVRQYWYELSGERMMPADLVLGLDENGMTTIRFRDPHRQERLPKVRMAQGGGKMAGIAASEGCPGIALVALPKTEQELTDLLDAEEVRWFKSYGGDPRETLARIQAARQAVASALIPGTPDGKLDILIRGADPVTGLLLAVLGMNLAAQFPEYDRQLLQVQTVREKDLIIATTLCQRAE